jgi:hypothetical protein
VRRFRIWWGLAMAAMAIAGLGYLVVWNQQREARKICGLIVLIDDRYQKLPAGADPDAREFARAVHDYRLDLGCKERP